MRTGTNTKGRAIALISLMTVLTASSTQLQADTGECGGQMITLPFKDVPAANIFFCSIAEAFFSGLTNGTSPTTYNPSDPVPREQMAAFITRTMDQSVTRSSKRAALDQYWTTRANLAVTDVGGGPSLVKSDGLDLWVANSISGTVSRIRASDGTLLQTWTGATGAFGVLCAAGKVFVTGMTSPGSLYQIDPTQPVGAVTTLSSALGDEPLGISYDGQRIWTANFSGSVSIVTLNPVAVTNVSTGFNSLAGVVYDGTNIWVTDQGDNMLKKLDSTGSVVLPISVGTAPLFLAFDGTNLWVPNHSSNTVTVVRAAGDFVGAVLTTATGNGMSGPDSVAFDGERILVTNEISSTVSLWKATDFSPIGSVSTGASTSPYGACSDGLNFWITLRGPLKLARY